MENPRKAAKCMDFLSTGEMMNFHRKGGEMGRESLSTESPHTENRKCGEKGWGDPAKSYRETLRRGDPCGRPREGQSPSPTHHKIRFRRGRRPRRPDPDFSRTPGRAHGPCPTKCSAVGRDPCVPPHPAPLVNTLSFRDQCAHWSWGANRALPVAEEAR